MFDFYTFQSLNQLDMIELSLRICLLDEELQQVYDEIPQETKLFFVGRNNKFRLLESSGINSEESICRLLNAIFSAKLVCNAADLLTAVQ